MQFRQQADAVLAKAEEAVRQVLASAAAAGDYDAVRSLADIAEQLREIRAPGQEVGRFTDSSNAGNASSGPRAPSSKARPRRKTKKAATSKSNGYPRFLRTGDDTLVKVGWSKKKKKEYQHKAPKRAAELLAKALVKSAASGEVVASSDFLPLVDPADESVVPDYQAYLCLLWLRTEGLVEQVGRQGYTVTSDLRSDDAIENQWARLPKVRG